MIIFPCPVNTMTILYLRGWKSKQKYIYLSYPLSTCSPRCHPRREYPKVLDDMKGRKREKGVPFRYTATARPWGRWVMFSLYVFFIYLIIYSKSRHLSKVIWKERCLFGSWQHVGVLVNKNTVLWTFKSITGYTWLIVCFMKTLINCVDDRLHTHMFICT